MFVWVFIVGRVEMAGMFLLGDGNADVAYTGRLRLLTKLSKI